MIPADYTTRDDGVLLNCLGRVVDPGLCREYGWPIPAQQEAAYSEYMAGVVGEYRAAQARRMPEERAEEAFELRAAFGPGQRVVNVLTGEYTLT